MMPPPTDVASDPVSSPKILLQNKTEPSAVSFSGAQPPVGSFTGAQPPAVSFSGTRPPAGSFSTGAQPHAGSFSTGAQPRVASFSGVQPPAGSFTGAWPPAGSFSTGAQPQVASFSGVQPPESSLTGAQPPAGSFSTGAQPPVASFPLVQPPAGPLIGARTHAGSFRTEDQPLVASFPGVQPPVGSFTGAQPPAVSFSRTRSPAGSFSTGAQPQVASFSGVQPPRGSLTGVQPPAGSFSIGSQPPVASFPGVQPPAGPLAGAGTPASSFTGAQPHAGSFSTGAQPQVASFSGLQPPTGLLTGARSPAGSFSTGAQPPAVSFTGVLPPVGSFTGVQPPPCYFTEAKSSVDSITPSAQKTQGHHHHCRQMPVFSKFVSSTETDDINDLKTRLKESLRRNLKDCLKHDWLEEGLNYPLMKYYTDLMWVEMIKEAMGKKKKPMKGMDEILEVPGAGKRGLNILVETRAGMGKTCSMARFAMVYAEDKEKFPFDFVFFIPLSNIREDCSLAEVIIAEHDQLEKEDAGCIQSILKGKTKHKVLLLLDGYDEYTRGINKEIDRAVEKTVGKCLIILTSRPVGEKYFNQNIRNKMVSEVVIEGFNTENIRSCCLLYLGSEEECEQFLEEVKKQSTKSLRGECNGLYELLKVPIMLLMLCVMYKESEDKSLPQRRTQTYEELYQLVMDRTTLKSHNFGCESKKVPNIKSMLQILGQFAWEGLQSNEKQQLLNDRDLEKKFPDIKKLGLISVINRDFGASKYICHRLETAADVKVTLNELFPSWKAVKGFSEVILFTVGLMKNPTSLIDYVYETYIEQCLHTWECHTEDEEELFKLIYMESTIPLPGQPLHNQYINYYKQQRSHEIEPVYRPSKLYVFSFLKQGVLCNVADRSHTVEVPECTIMINEPCSSAVTESLLATCQRLCQHQTIANLVLKGLKCEVLGETDLFRLSENTQTIRIISCKLTLEIMSHLMQQCCKCKYITRLDLSGTSLVEGGHHLVQAILSWADGPSLQELILDNCSIPGDVCDKLLQSVSTCNHLINFSVANTTLTGFLSSFLPDPHPGLPELKMLNLEAATLNTGDLQHLLIIFKYNKLRNFNTWIYPTIF